MNKIIILTITLCFIGLSNLSFAQTSKCKDVKNLSFNIPPNINGIITSASFRSASNNYGILTNRNSVLKDMLKDLGLANDQDPCSGTCTFSPAECIMVDIDAENANIEFRLVRNPQNPYLSYYEFDIDTWRRTHPGEAFEYKVDCDCVKKSGSGYGNTRSKDSDIDQTFNTIPDAISIGVQPNPNNGNFLLTIDAPESDDLMINIYDLQGKLVYQESLFVIKGKFRKDITLPFEIPSGIYLVEANTSKKSSIEKVILLK